MRLWAIGLALVLLAGPVRAAEPRQPGEYPPTQDSLPQANVAKGKLIGPLELTPKLPTFTSSSVQLEMTLGDRPAGNIQSLPLVLSSKRSPAASVWNDDTLMSISVLPL